MTRTSTPPPRPPPAPAPAPDDQHETHHLPPSLPNSPLAKRLKPDTDTATTSAVKMSSTSNREESVVPVPKLTATSHPPLLIKKLSADATTPTRGSAFAAGYDLYASKPTTIPARGKALVSTDLSIATPEGTYGRIAPRSGLAAKHFIDTGAGVIDADYRGEVKVLLFNHAETDFRVDKGDRIAQLVLERIYTPEIVEVDSLEESVRGAGGFGSTGVGVANTGAA
ncbi:deoxyuridine 5'-triphosphate nucleotidohydrolase [Cladophialophora carrionii CBS 160.54]|uniref:Deoxyuridine 5'-triphosphate nucleotidohydrolase n=1 Tax=Cladophialophora carrionii CBS 160.54 TaxID=1279043 RepID=V9D3A9_9EURO|nr:deoxyuridine 5'-triphosphate nucleotidohydrolase [Cladophialophora carrionii CBS 160.54]ETI20482.1 deoxyuridine 5'-triphosphate nucleotidohydrolase [Cladophialophora carrionii CBS 160.54]